MKNISQVLFAAIAVAIVSGSALAADVDTVSVTGSGEMAVTPDVVYVDLSVVTHSKTAAEAQNLNAQQAQPLFTLFANRYSLTEKEVKTTAYNITPDYSTTNVNNTSRSQVVGYAVTNSLRVTIRNLKVLDQFIDDAGQAGANQVSSVTFGTEKEREYQNQALKLAMQDARAKADVVAQSTGQAIIKVSKVTVNDYNRPVRAYAMAASAPSAPGAHTNISSGDLNVSINVSVDYIIQ